MATQQGTTWGNTPQPKKSSAWKQAVNLPKTNTTSKKAVNRMRTGRAKTNKLF